MTDERPKTTQKLREGLRRVLAPNPSPMTHWGTNTYILGEGRVAVIDPGPADRAHLDAILGALAPGETISHILVTHSHLDHSPLARPLADATGAPVLAFGDSAAGRSAVMRDLARAGLAGGGEGVDREFAPDETLADGDVLAGSGWQIEAIWTPGHMGNHLCFGWEDTVFTGDHVMGWASTMVSPPDGDLGDFMRSTRRLAGLGAAVFYPAHGAPIEAPHERANWLIDHRLSREAEILRALENGPAGVSALTRAIYRDLPDALLGAAARNVFAHLVDLRERGRVETRADLGLEAVFALV